MLSANSGPKKVLFFFLPFILFSIFSLVSLLFLNIFERNFGMAVSHITGSDVSVGRISFSPFEGIRLKEISFYRKGQDRIKVRSILFKYSFWQLFHKKIKFKKIFVEKIDLFKARKSESLKSDIPSKRPLFRQKRRPNDFLVTFDETSFIFKNLRIHFLSESGPPRVLTINFRVDRQKQALRCHGSIDFHQTNLLSKTFRNAFVSKNIAQFFIKGERIQDDIVLDNIRVNLGAYFFQGTGLIKSVTRNPIADIKFYSSTIPLKTIGLFRSFHPAKGYINILGYLKGPLTSLILKAELSAPSIMVTVNDESVYLSHFFCLLSYDAFSQRVSLRKATFLLNEKFLIQANGYLPKVFSSLFKLFCRVTKKPSIEDRNEMKGDISFILDGKLKEKMFLGSLQLARNDTAKQYRLDFNDIMLMFSQNREKGCRVKIKSGELWIREILLGIGRDELLQNFYFNDIFVGISLNKRTINVQKLFMKGYGGSLLTKGVLVRDKEDDRYVFKTILKNLTFKKKHLFYPFSCLLSGTLNGWVSVEKGEQKRSIVNGEIVAEHFALSKMPVLNDISEFLGIESIKNIDQAQVVSQFSIFPWGGKKLRLDLDASTFRMRSNLEIDKRNWISGTVALGLPREILMESKIFKRLMSMAKERDQWLDFVLRLNGYENSIRIELEESQLRDKLKERVSPGIQKIIVNMVDKVMATP